MASFGLSAAGVDLTSILGDERNLIGNPMADTATLTLPSGSVAFIWDATAGSYASSGTLAPGQGAWVKGAAGETVEFSGGEEPEEPEGSAYSGGPSEGTTFTDHDVALDTTNQKVYSKYFEVSYSGDTEIDVVAGGSVQLTLAPSLTSFTLFDGCGCYGDFPGGPVPCGGCSSAAWLGFCQCEGDLFTIPVNLRLEEITGTVVGAPDSSVATATLDPLTGTLTISGVAAGTTTVAVEAWLHHEGVDQYTAQTAADDDFMAYRYSIPLVLTISVG